MRTKVSTDDDMVNTGAPSRGCYTCRKRRIKCDERKPQCHRCEKSKRRCEGYPSGDLVFRNENAVAQKNAVLDLSRKPQSKFYGNKYSSLPGYEAEKALSRPVDTRSGSPIVVRGSKNPFDFFATEVAPAYDQTLPILKIFPVDSGHAVLCNLFTSAKVSQNSTLRIAKDMHLQAGPDSALVPLSEAIGWINAPSGYDLMRAFNQARLRYAEAVVKLRRTIESSDSAPLNETLLVILFMSMAEMAIGNATDIGNMVLAHLKGALSLIRASARPHTLPYLYSPVLIGLINHMLGCYITAPLGTALQVGSDFKVLYKVTNAFSQLPKGTSRLVQIGFMSAELHTEIKSRRHTAWSGVSRTEMEQLYRRCVAAVNLVEAWSYLWIPGSQVSKKTKEDLFGGISVWNPKVGQVRVSLWEHKDWGQICAYRLLIYAAMRDCLSKYIPMVPPDEPGNRFVLKDMDTKMRSLIENVAEEMKENMSLFLNGQNRNPGGPDAKLQDMPEPFPRIGAYVMILPMRIARSLTCLSDAGKRNIEAATELLIRHGGLGREFLIARLYDNVFD